MNAQRKWLRLHSQRCHEYSDDVDGLQNVKICEILIRNWYKSNIVFTGFHRGNSIYLLLALFYCNIIFILSSRMKRNGINNGYFDEECNRIKKDFSEKFSSVLAQMNQDLESMVSDIKSIENHISFEYIQSVIKEEK